MIYLGISIRANLSKFWNTYILYQTYERCTTQWLLARTPAGSSQYQYTVEMLNPHSATIESMGRIPRGERHIVTEMPREAICFTDKPYSTDQYLATAFRHEIGLPEGVFPTAWMDLKSL